MFLTNGTKTLCNFFTVSYTRVPLNMHGSKQTPKVDREQKSRERQINNVHKGNLATKLSIHMYAPKVYTSKPLNIYASQGIYVHQLLLLMSPLPPVLMPVAKCCKQHTKMSLAVVLTASATHSCKARVYPQCAYLNNAIKAKERTCGHLTGTAAKASW